jgi:hypothetical protein
MKVVAKASAVVGVLALTTACGGGGGDSFADKPLKEITTTVSSDMKDLKSLHMSGQLTSSDQKVGLDLSVTTDGQCQGTVSVGGGSAQVLSTGDRSWMKPDDAFWEEQAPDQASLIEQTVGDKWVVAPSETDFASFCDLDSFLDAFDKDNDKSDGPTEKGGVESVGGSDALKLLGKSDGQDMSAWVAVDSPHRLLKIELAPGGDTSGTVTFSEFDEPVDVKAPADSEVIDLSSLGG